MTATIRISYADGRIRELDLQFGNYEVGRDRGYIVLGDEHCSSVHAHLHVHPAGVTVMDVGSANGTFNADGTRVAGPVSMHLDHPIRLGRSELTLVRFFAPSGGTVLAPSSRAPVGAAPFVDHGAPVLHPQTPSPPPNVGWAPALAQGRASRRSERRVGLIGVVVVGVVTAVVICALLLLPSPPTEVEAKAAFVRAIGGGAQVERMVGAFALHGCKASEQGGYTCDFSIERRAMSARFIAVDGEWKAILNSSGM